MVATTVVRTDYESVEMLAYQLETLLVDKSVVLLDSTTVAP